MFGGFRVGMMALNALPVREIQPYDPAKPHFRPGQQATFFLRLAALALVLGVAAAIAGFTVAYFQDNARAGTSCTTSAPLPAALQGQAGTWNASGSQCIANVTPVP